MRYLKLLLLALVLAGCAPDTNTTGDGGLNIFEDPEHGVVCYQRFTVSDAIACVKVTP